MIIWVYIRERESSFQEHCERKSESIEVQFDEFIGLIQQSKESVLSELSTRQQEEMSLVSQSLKELDKKQAELAEVLTSLNETLKMEKILALKVSIDTYNICLIYFYLRKKIPFRLQEQQIQL